MKATGGRIRSPPRRNYNREKDVAEVKRREDRIGQVSHKAETVDGGVTDQNPMACLEVKKRRESRAEGGRVI